MDSPQHREVHMTRLTDAELAAMEARANAATEGDWRVVRRTPVMGAFDIEYSRGSPFFANTETLADADFIASARSDVPRLLAELKAERERCAELRRLVEVYGGLGVDRCGGCGQLGFHESTWHQQDCAVAKALKETE